MKANLLRAELVARDMQITSLAETMGVNPQTLYNKISGRTQFTVDEAVQICDILGIVDNEKKASIFLT